MKRKFNLFGWVLEVSLSRSQYYEYQVHQLNKNGHENELLACHLSTSKGEAIAKARQAAEHWVRSERMPVVMSVYEFPDRKLVWSANKYLEVVYRIKEAKTLN